MATAFRLRKVTNTVTLRERNAVPLKLSRDAQILYLSVLDYPGNWRISAPSRTFIPELRKRFPNVTAVELSDRTSPAEIELVRAMAARYDAVVASVFVRASSASGRMDLAEPLHLQPGHRSFAWPQDDNRVRARPASLRGRSFAPMPPRSFASAAERPRSG